jgi:hypothetical protein
MNILHRFSEIVIRTLLFLISILFSASAALVASLRDGYAANANPLFSPEILSFISLTATTRGRSYLAPAKSSESFTSDSVMLRGSPPINISDPDNATWSFVTLGEGTSLFPPFDSNVFSVCPCDIVPFPSFVGSLSPTGC